MIRYFAREKILEGYEKRMKSVRISPVFDFFDFII